VCVCVCPSSFEIVNKQCITLCILSTDVILLINTFLIISASIFGIWFYDKDECARIGQLMNRCVLVSVFAFVFLFVCDNNIWSSYVTIMAEQWIGYLNYSFYCHKFIYVFEIKMPIYVWTLLNVGLCCVSFHMKLYARTHARTHTYTLCVCVCLLYGVLLYFYYFIVLQFS